MSPEHILWLGLVNWLATLILVEGVIFETPRAWLVQRAPHPKLRYLLTCQLCAGTWVGFVLAALFGGPFGFVLVDGLLYKAIGHATLELASFLRYGAAAFQRLAEPAPPPPVPPVSPQRLPHTLERLHAIYAQAHPVRPS